MKNTFKIIVFALLFLFCTFLQAQSLDYKSPASGDLSTAKFNSIALSVAIEDTNPYDMIFNGDGTVLYVLGKADGDINQYDLSTAYDVSTAVFSAIALSVVSEDISPRSILFNGDGSRLFVLGLTTNAIFQYNLSSNYDISTANFVATVLNVNAEEASPTSMIFNGDGSKLYVTGLGNDINQYYLSTAYDVSTTSFTSIALDISTQVSNPRSMVFADNGTELYILGSTGTVREVYHFALSTAYYIATAVFNGDSFSVFSEESSPRSIIVNNKGTKMYVMGIVGDDINQYDIGFNSYPEASANDGSIDNTYPLTINLNGDTFSTSSGPLSSALYTLGNVPAGLTSTLLIDASSTQATLTFTGNAIAHQNLDDVSPLTFAFSDGAFTNNLAGNIINSGSVTPYDTTIGIDFVDNPRLNYVVDEPYDISIASFNSSVLDVSAQESRPFAMLFNDDGSKLYVTGWDNNNINQYDLTSAFDVSTATFNQVAFIELNTGLHHIQTLQYNNDGTMLYVLVSDGYIWQYLLTTAYDIATAQPIEFFPYANILDSDTIDMVYNGDGTILYVMHPTAKDIEQYNLSTAYDILTASEVGTVITFAGIIDLATSLIFNSDGSKLYVTDAGNNTIHQYDLATAYDLTSASYGQISLDLTTTAIMPLAIIFNNDGSSLYVSDFVSSTINQFDINQTIYAETLSNDGSVDNSHPLIITLVDDSFSTSSAALPVALYSVGNVPAGLTPVLNIDSSGTQAVLSLTGNAIDHLDINDINDLSFSFTDAAFIGGDATNVVNSGVNSAYSTNTAVDFLDEYRLDYILTPELDLTSAVYSGTAIDLVLAIPYDMIFNNDGTVLYLLRPSLRNISQYNLMRAYDISTARYVGEVLNIFDQDYQPVSMIFSNDGYKLYILGASGLDVNQYDLSNAYDISTATFSAVVMNVDAQGTSPRSMLFNNDGTQLYIITNSNLGNISQYNMTIPYDISTASFNQTALNVAEQETRPQSIFFNHDGSKLYVMGYQGDDVNQYNLTIAYDISSAVFDRVAFRFPEQELDPTSMIFNGDGSTLYIAGNDKIIEQYDLSPTIYQETVANDGTVNNTRSLSIKLNNSTFTSSGTALPTNQYSITGMPNGLSAVLNIDPTATTATLAFTGAAPNHQDLNDIVANLAFSFTDAAFSNNNANNIVNSGSITPFMQNIEFDFNDNITMTYTVGQYDENSSNIGMIDNTTPLTINLAGDITTGHFTTSSGVLPSSLYTIGRVPAGLTPILTVDSTGTLATLTFSGTATSHQINNNVIDFPFRFHDAAFTNNDAKIIVNSGFGINIYIAAARIDFIDNPRLAYVLAAASYPEALANDGSIDNSNPIVITSIGETFSVNSVDLPSTQYSIGNLPAGLTPVLSIDALGTQAVLTLTGNAISHQNFHDVSDLTFTFTDDAFTNGNASVVLNSGFFSAFSSNIGIDFADNPGFPVAVDDNYTVKVDGNLILFPLTGDTDPDGDTLSVISLNGVPLTGGSTQSIAVPNGVVTVLLGSSFQFIPDANFIGTVSFPYTITDNNGGTAIANQIIRIDVFSSIGGAITGLNGGVNINLNGIENTSLNVNGPYNFFNQLINGSSYLVTINTQPTSPNKTCVIVNGSGTVTGTDITNVDITCTTNTYFIGGSVTGLINDNSIVLQNNLSDDLQLCNQTTFVFSTPLTDQSTYDITILTPTNSPTQNCSVVNGSSTLAGDDVTNVEIACANDGEIIYRNSFEEGCLIQ